MKEKIAKSLSEVVNLPAKEILELIEVPKDSSLGDFAFPCFTLAKTLKKNPAEIAKELSKKIKREKEFEKIESLRAYVNFFVDRNYLASLTLEKIKKEKDKFGSLDFGKNKKIVIEFSSPNIAKPFGIGHLRSTIIGNSIANISEFLGFDVVRLNYLGDWGTQFGKLILGYKKFGNPSKLKKDPIKHLLSLYIKVNQNKSLDEESRSWFKKLEEGNIEAVKLWKTFRALSLKEFQEVYDLLDIKFDVVSGESQYNKQLKSIVKELIAKCLLEKSEGALIVNLEKYNLGVVLIEKSDGTTLYATRDIAAAIDRHKKYRFDSMIYEVGSEQNLHFNQVFKVLDLMGNKWAKNCVHIPHGLYLGKDGKKFATRKGKTVFMEDIINEAMGLAKKEILKRFPNIKEKELEKRALSIALSAILYGDLKNYRTNDMIFDIERFTSFEGNTGPYLLYTYARARSILKKANFNPKKKYVLSALNEIEKNLLSQLLSFSEVVLQAYNTFSPNLVANYAYQIAQTFNEFYHSEKVIGSESEQFRLVLVDSFSRVLKNALTLLGISAIEEM